MVRRLLTEAKAARAGGTIPAISLAKFTAAMTAVNFARVVAGRGWRSMVGARGSYEKNVRYCEENVEEGPTVKTRTDDHGHRVGVGERWETFMTPCTLDRADRTHSRFFNVRAFHRKSIFENLQRLDVPGFDGLGLPHTDLRSANETCLFRCVQPPQAHNRCEPIRLPPQVSCTPAQHLLVTNRKGLGHLTRCPTVQGSLQPSIVLQLNSVGPLYKSLTLKSCLPIRFPSPHQYCFRST